MHLNGLCSRDKRAGPRYAGQPDGCRLVRQACSRVFYGSTCHLQQSGGRQHGLPVHHMILQIKFRPRKQRSIPLLCQIRCIDMQQRMKISLPGTAAGYIGMFLSAGNPIPFSGERIGRQPQPPRQEARTGVKPGPIHCPAPHPEPEELVPFSFCHPMIHCSSHIFILGEQCHHFFIASDPVPVYVQEAAARFSA